MATVKIRKAALDTLPPVCAVCGARADHARVEKFVWSPSWVLVLWLVGLLPAVIALALTRKSMTVPLPVCDEHRRHLPGRQAVVTGGLVLALVTGLAGAGLHLAGHEGIGEDILLGAVGVLVLVGVVVFVFGESGVRPEEITDRSITLAGVCEQFVDAVERNPEPARASGPGGGMALQSARYYHARR